MSREAIGKVVLILLMLLMSFVFVSAGLAFSKVPSEKASQDKLIIENASAPTKAPVDEKTRVSKKPAPRAKASGFAGRVTMAGANVIAVEGRKGSVAFDASNPELKGYSTIGDVVVGDTVAVEYTRNGLSITKLKGTAKRKASGGKKAEKKEKAEPKIVPTKAPVDKKTRVSKKPAPRAKASGFAGRVTMAGANVIAVEGRKGSVAFDASNPELKGYSTIGDVVVGDTVAVEYTRNGLSITKLKGTAKRKASGGKKAEKEKKPSSETVITQIDCSGKGPCTVSVDQRKE